MIIKVNQNGISIDVSMSTELTDRFKTTHGTIPRHNIDKFKIFKHPNIGDVVEVVDLHNDEFYIHHSLITSINGDAGFNSALEVFNKINFELFGL